MNSHMLDQSSRSPRRAMDESSSRHAGSSAGNYWLAIQRKIGNQAFGKLAPAVQRLYQLNRGRVTDDAVEYTLQRPVGNQAQALGRLAPAVQRMYVIDGAPVNTEMLDYKVPGVEPPVDPPIRLISYTKRHTIKGFVQGGTTKALNTLLLKKVEMKGVATDAYTTAWNPTAGRLNVKDGTTFVSAGITWGVTAQPSDNTIHIWPVSGSTETIDISGNEKGPLATYLGWRTRGKAHAESETFALDLLQKKGGDAEKFNKCVAALIAMGEVAT